MTNGFAAERDVIIVDYPGIGGSSGETPSNVASLTKACVKFCRALNLTQFDVAGFSLGGIIAQQAALDASGLVRCLILAGTGPTGGEGIQTLSPQVLAIVGRPNTTDAERALELFFSPTATSQAAGKAWISRISARQHIDREPPTKPQVAQAMLVALAKWGKITDDRCGALKGITQSTLVVNGKNDIMVPTVNSYILQQHPPDARPVLYPDSGHGAHFQFPDEFAELAAGFVAAA